MNETESGPAPVASPTADRNLLFGILALQMDFISRDALIAAMHAWVLDKTKSLGHILIEQGALSGMRCGLLDALVEEHLAAHGQDPQRSLTAIRSPLSLIHDLQELSDPGVRASLALLCAAGRGRDIPDTRPPSQAPPSSAEPRFRILRPHARGGLGEVFLAHDQELQRDVALKEIQTRHADEASSRARFLLEAQITGGLEHPGVVPVYGLGQYADGRPYYAMRFIRGESLKEAIDRFHAADVLGRAAGERSLALRELLSRFIAVCNAVAYAHSRGIIHRDLKPGNVMLGPYGETLVVDWGLAKAIGRAGDETCLPEATLRPTPAVAVTPTLFGQALGTPGFMSPEQAAGRLEDMGQKSDVYSLGATLYCLLTGKAPFEGPLGEVLERVRRGQFRPPRQVKPTVLASLEAICLKAMALRPEDRYASAPALADDLQHWLADEPVSCYREPWPARLARWGRRHRPAVAGIASLVLTGMVALGLGLFAVVREQRHTEEQRQAAVKARQQAETQSQLALRTLKDVVFDIQSLPERVPAAHGMRRKMLQTAIAGLKEVAASASTAEQKDHSLIQAHCDLGDIFLEIGDTAPGDWTNEAAGHYQQAVEIAQALLDAHPQSTAAQRDLALAYIRRGDARQKQGKTREAQDDYQKSMALRQRLADAGATPEAQRDLALAYNKMGDVSRLLGDSPGARDYFQKQLDLIRPLAAAQPNDREMQRDLSVAYERLGEVNLDLDQPAAARDAFQKDLDIAQKLADGDPDNVQAQLDLAISSQRLGDMSLRQGDSRAAGDLYQKSLDIRKKQVDADPQNPLLGQDLTISYERMGTLSLQRGETAASRAWYQKSLDLRQKLVDADRSNAQLQRDLFVSHHKVGKAALRQGDMEAARKAFAHALEITQKLAEADADNVLAQRDLLVAHYQQGQCHEQDLAFAEAATCYGHSLDILGRLERAGKLKGQPLYVQWRREMEQAQAVCQAAPQAIADLDFVLKQRPELVTPLLALRIRALTRQGRLEEATATAEKGHDLAGKDANRLYDAACGFALCCSSKEPNAKSAARAVAVLREAVEQGYKDVGHIKADADLDALRDRDDFRDLLAQLEK
jgi:serine/threonine protein kinase/tetratricopeptide (TPR) repeat protein